MLQVVEGHATAVFKLPEHQTFQAGGWKGRKYPSCKTPTVSPGRKIPFWFPASFPNVVGRLTALHKQVL